VRFHGIPDIAAVKLYLTIRTAIPPSLQADMSASESDCYAMRSLNPFQGVAQILETPQARAIGNDGLNWRIQIRSEIYKTPWSSLAIPTHYDRYFVYGVWSHTDGLARVPVHPSLYQEHVEQAVQNLLAQLSKASRRLPFPLRDSIELWLMDASATQPIALIASQLSQAEIPMHKSLHWYPTENSDTPFNSNAFAADQARATIKSQTQDLLLQLIKQRCTLPFQAFWIERHSDGSGCIVCNHTGKTSRRGELLDANAFPPCLLSEDWQVPEAQQLVTDYLNWQAPLLLMLPLPAPCRQQLEVQAQQRPLAVHTYHRLYPEVIDQALLNKILVEAVMRKATSLA
jgi:hypothetical protein